MQRKVEVVLGLRGAMGRQGGLTAKGEEKQQILEGGLTIGRGQGDSQREQGTRMGTDLKLPRILLDDGQGKSSVDDEREPSDMDISESDESGPKGICGVSDISTGELELLRPPVLAASGTAVTGLEGDKLRRQNKRQRIALLQEQGEYSQWTTHKGEHFLTPGEWESPGIAPEGKTMHLRGRALLHPVAQLLQEWSEGGCPTKTGRDWTLREMQAAIEKGPHKSAMEPGALIHFREEVADKVKGGQARLVLWDEIKAAPPTQLKISPVAAIPHKSKPYRSILDLSFSLRLQNGGGVAGCERHHYTDDTTGGAGSDGAFTTATDPRVCRVGARGEGVLSKMGHKGWVLAVGL